MPQIVDIIRDFRAARAEGLARAGHPAGEVASRSRDVVAGVSVAGLLLPEAVAYAGIAGLPPQAGVIGLMAGLLCYAALGRSPVAVVAATSSSAAVLGAATLSLAGPDAGLRLALAAGLVLLTGALFAIASLARLGAISNFISRPVMHGFAFGMALTITVRQLARMAGVTGCAPEVYRCAAQVAQAHAQWNAAGLCTGAAVFALLLVLARWQRVPGPVLALAAAVAASVTLGLPAQGVAVVGSIRLAWPQLAWPLLDRDAWVQLAELALPLALLVFAESWGAIRGNALPGTVAPSAQRELAALAAANVVSGLLHGTPVGAGFSATAANRAAGAESRLAGLVAAAASLALLAVALGAIERAPEAALCAVVIAAVRHGLDLRRLQCYFRWRRDRMVLVVAALAVIVLGIVYGLLVGVATSLVMTLRELATPRLSELGRAGNGHDFLGLAAHADARAVPGVCVLRPEAPLFFANAERMLAEAQRVAHDRAAPAIVLSLEETHDLDATALQALADFCAHQREGGVRVALARLKDPAMALLQDAALPGLRGVVLEPGSVDDAVQRMLAIAPARGVPSSRPAPGSGAA